MRGQPYSGIWREPGRRGDPRHRRPRFGRQPNRPAGHIDAGDGELGPNERVRSALRFLQHVERRAAHFTDPRYDLDPLVETRGLQVLNGTAAHDPVQAGRGAQPRMIVAERAQQLGPSTLQESQPVRVVDDPRRVGVLVVDADGQPVGALGDGTG